MSKYDNMINGFELVLDLSSFSSDGSSPYFLFGRKKRFRLTDTTDIGCLFRVKIILFLEPPEVVLPDDKLPSKG